MSFLVLNLEPDDFSERAISRVNEFATYKALPYGLSEDDFWQEVRNADILWTRLGHYLDEDFVSRAKNLRIIVSPTTGLNHIDLEACEKRNVMVVSLKGEAEFLSSITSTAELTISLMLEAVRHTGRAHNDVVNEGNWDRDSFRGRQLAGKKLGIIGMGRLGRIVAEYALAFRMEVVYFDDANVKDVPSGVKTLGLNELLQTSDFVSLHANYKSENHRMFSGREFELMKKGGWLINTARGELIDEASLLDALKSQSIAGAAIDVLENESVAIEMGLSHPLIKYARENDNLIITPHIGGASSDAMEATEIFAAEKLYSTIRTLSK